MGAGAAQGGHIWRACKASSAPLSTTLETRFALPSATPPLSMPVPPAPAWARRTKSGQSPARAAFSWALALGGGWPAGWLRLGSSLSI
jgi:hypothetical protein